MKKPKRVSRKKRLYEKLIRALCETTGLGDTLHKAMIHLARMVQKMNTPSTTWEEIAAGIEKTQLILDEIADRSQDIRVDMATIELDFMPMPRR
ncbi:MAG: hypothetical protein QXI19_02195 [Candidatus Caldarchaeum sp.]